MLKKIQFVNLMEAYSKAPESLESIIKQVNVFSDFVRQNVPAEASAMRCRFEFGLPEMENISKHLNRIWRNSYDAATHACTILNDLYQKAGFQKIFSGDLKQESDVTTFCMSFVTGM